MKLPDYCDYGGASITFDPPFPFTDVTVATFPLRADLDTMQGFIDSYLNIVPPEVGHFHVSMPYVYLMLLDYGKLANRSDNFGCFSQREMFFFIPLDWYRRIGGRLVFHDFAMVAPWIYVDAEISLTLGRTAIGWPKSMVTVTPELTGWLKDPDGITTDVCVSAEVFDHTYTGAPMKLRPMVMVRSPMTSSLRVPFDPESPMAPWNVWANVGRSVTGLWQDYFKLLGAGGVLPPNAATSPENFARKLERMMSGAASSFPWAPNATLNTINLKQFRCADDPKVPCYQALTRGPLRYTSFMRGGLLGNQLVDSSGGYVVDLACWPTFPVVDALGIEANIYSIDDGPTLARAKPVMPYWYEVNMEYDRTETLALRGRDGEWLDGDGERIAGRADKKSRYFNTAIGAASPVVTGPFRFQSAAIRLLSLSASLEKLQEFLDAYLNTPLADVDQTFRVWHGTPSSHDGVEYVRMYMAVIDWGHVTSATNSLGDWADTTVTFYIPVERVHKKTGELLGLGLFPAYSFARGTIHTCTLTELFGIPTTQATFVEGRGEAGDLERMKPFRALELSVESVPALHEGQMVRSMKLLDLVDTGDPKPSGIPRNPHGRAGWLGGDIPVYTLKQFRDVEQPSKACYQALVHVPHRIWVTEVLEVPRKAELHMHPIPMYPVHRKLGLRDKNHELESSYGIPHIVEVEHWYLLKAEILIDDGVELYSRIGEHWHPGKDSGPFHQPVSGPLSGGPDALIDALFRGLPSDPPPSWVTLGGTESP